MAQTTSSFVAEWQPYRQSAASGAWVSERSANQMSVHTSVTGGGEEPNGPQMLSWEALRNTDRAEVDALVRVRSTEHPGGAIYRGVSLFARLPAAPFTPSAGLAHMLHRSNNTLRIYSGVFDPFNSPPAGSSVDLGSIMPIGAWHWMRLQVTRTETHEVLRGKMWLDGEPEPAWQVTRSRLLTGSGIPAVGGAIGVGNGGGGGWSSSTRAVYEWDHASDLLAPGVARIRSSVSEDAGSLFQATQAAAVELGLSEAFEYGEDIPAGWLRAFSEALTPDATAVSYYALPTRNQEMLVTVEGETNLGRMASTYPNRIMRRGIEIPGNVGGQVTPQQAIQYIFDQWASEFPWFSAESVPDLRLPVPGALTAPRQYYLENPTAGLLSHGAVSIPQEVHPDGRDERQTMREIADEWTAIFPGTVLRQTSRGTIELVPRVGPDAPDTPLLLTWQDLKGISDGEDDPRGVINRARVVVQGWRFEDEQGITAPAFLAIGGMPDAAWPDPPDPNALPDDRERLTDGATQRFVLLTAGDSIRVSWAATEATVEQSGGSWAHFSIRGSDSGEVTLTRAQPTQTVTVNATLYWGVANLNRLNYATTWRFSWDGDVGISVAAGTVGDVYTERILGSTGRTWYLGHLLEFAAFGTAWVRSKESIIGEFGRPGDQLPGPDGTNALTESRALYGERQATINSTQFQLTPEQARQVAEAHVLFNINPRTVRDVQQSEWDKYPVKFDHIGRLVDLPTGERAVIENRSYSDSFSSTHGAMASSFSASVTEIVIDTSTDWLLLDNGDFFQLDNGDLVEVS